ncbi:hypothetical protein ACFL3S_02345 [Gemmatimonadota bacterium]
MSGPSGPVLRALGRWEKKGLLTPDLAGTLRMEVEEETQGEALRWSQYALAATGGAVLIIAGATFLSWAWPEMGYGGQSLALGIIGLLVLGLGLRLHGRGRWGPVAYLLLLAGPFLLLMALAYSENAWPDRSFGGVVAGLLGLGIPLSLVAFSLRRDPVMAALHSAIAFLFLFLFLDRALGLDLKTCLWILDGVLVVGLAVMAFRLRDPSGPEWTLNLFTALLYATPVLLFLTGDILWELDELAIIPLDIWLVLVAGLTLWTLHEKAPVHLKRDWNERQLAYCLLLGIIFALITTLEAMDAGPNTAALSVAALGGLGLWFALPRGSRPVLVASCLALLIAAWYYGAEKAGALGAVLALSVTAALLFWGSSRLGGGSRERETSSS